jgi:hypothetical protein
MIWNENQIMVYATVVARLAIIEMRRELNSSWKDSIMIHPISYFFGLVCSLIVSSIQTDKGWLYNYAPYILIPDWE